MGKRLKMLITEEGLNRDLSRIRVVQATVGKLADRGAAVAMTQLAAHEYEGHSRIERTGNRTDGFIVLDDSRGLKAALSIEYGRNGGKGAVRPLGMATKKLTGGKAMYGPRG